MPKNQLSIESLFSLIQEKIQEKDQNSYTSFLVKDGPEMACRKVGEEAVEVIIASFAYAKQQSSKLKKELVGEFCDLFYHSLVLMAAQGVDLDEIFTEFEKRNSQKNCQK